MATTGLTPAGDARVPVLGARIPGLSQLQFCEARLEDPVLHAWVAITGPAGEEPGRIVVTPQQVALNQLTAPLPVVTRRLSEAEIARLPEHIERTQAAFDAAIDAVRAAELPVFLTSVRFTLDGGAAIVAYRAPNEDVGSQLTATLAPVVRGVVHLQWEGTLEQMPDNLFGGVGRLRPEVDLLESTLATRLDPPGLATFAPATLPRLGTTVQTPEGPGTLRSVSTKHQTATVLLADGRTVEIPVADLAPGDA